MTAAFKVRSATWAADSEALRSVRVPVFVDEQCVHPDEEFDDVDLSCIHILAVDLSGRAIGTGRIDAHGKIGRMAVLKEWRVHGVGREILSFAVAIARKQKMSRVYLHAQLTAFGFYERAGFKAYGDPFREAAIDHRAMELFL
jgi:predicted GNAT family N-acyltransferase